MGCGFDVVGGGLYCVCVCVCGWGGLKGETWADKCPGVLSQVGDLVPSSYRMISEMGGYWLGSCTIKFTN